MALTVADVLKLKPFATGKVIAGENGVTRKVEHVSVMEVISQNGFPQSWFEVPLWKFPQCMPWSTILSGRWKPSDA